MFCGVDGTCAHLFDTADEFAHRLVDVRRVRAAAIGFLDHFRKPRDLRRQFANGTRCGFATLKRHGFKPVGKSGDAGFESFEGARIKIGDRFSTGTRHDLVEPVLDAGENACIRPAGFLLCRDFFEPGVHPVELHRNVLQCLRSGIGARADLTSQVCQLAFDRAGAVRGQAIAAAGGNGLYTLGHGVEAACKSVGDPIAGVARVGNGRSDLDQLVFDPLEIDRLIHRRHSVQGLAQGGNICLRAAFDARAELVDLLADGGEFAAGRRVELPGQIGKPVFERVAEMCRCAINPLGKLCDILAKSRDFRFSARVGLHGAGFRVEVLLALQNLGNGAVDAADTPVQFRIGR